MTSQIRLDKIRLEENRGDEEVVSDETPSAPPEPPEPPSSPKRKQRVKAEDPFIVFASTDADLLKALDDFEEMRKTVKRPLTYRAKTDLIGDLNRMSQDRNIWIASLSRSIKNCWLGVFYPKDDGKVEGVGDEEKRRRREITQKENEEIEAKIEREKEERLRKFRENGGVIAGPFGAPVFTPKKIED